MRRRRAFHAALLLLIGVLGLSGAGCGDDDGASADGGVDAAVAAPDSGPDALAPDGSPTVDAAPDPDGATNTPWIPPPGTTWAIQYADTPVDTTPDVAVYDLDLFDTPQATIDGLHAANRRVICYFSAGSYEDWRPDESQFPSECLGNGLSGWPGEFWLDVRHVGLRPVMSARLDLAVSKQCDGVDPDNVDGYTNNTGFPLTYQDQVDYLTWLATEAHQRGLSIGLKNDLEQIGELEALFDFAVNESCLDWNECELLHPFLNAGKAVFHLEYVNDPSEGAAKVAAVCGQAVIQQFSTLIKTWDLDAWYLGCP